MVASSTVVKWRLILYSIRFLFLIINTCVWYIQHLPTSLALMAIPVMLTCGCVNDLYMLTWDIYTNGSFFARPILQILISLALVSILILEMVSMDVMSSDNLDLMLGLNTVALLVITVLILAVSWIQSRLRGPGHGTRDLRWIRIFGTKRPSNDETRRLVRKVRKAIKRLPHWPKHIIYRRIVDVESTQHAMTQNIAAVLLLSLLLAQSVILIHGVIYEKFDTREVWRVPVGWVHPPDFCHFDLVHHDEINQSWSLFTRRSNSADNVTGIIPSTPESCRDEFGICLPADSICRAAHQADILDIAMIANISDHNSSSTPERVWMVDIGDTGWVTNSTTNITRLYDHGIHFMPGFQLSGLVTLAERRIIQSYFSDMWGFTPNYNIITISSIDWMQSTPLNNESVAWVTLRFNTPERYYGEGENYIRVIEDYRQHTFLSALSSIGGLLSVLQGLHILCFGKPLFWGMFGSKLLDPFGIFASGSRALRERMAIRYGFDMKSRTFSAEGLSLFLRDFVLDIGPLDKGDDDDDNIENEDEESPSATGETQTYDVIPLEGVAGDLEDDSRSTHVDSDNV